MDEGAWNFHKDHGGKACRLNHYTAYDKDFSAIELQIRLDKYLTRE
jgi:hypothetical protein